MQKEKLTMDKIKADLSGVFKRSIGDIIISTVFFLLFLGGVLLANKLTPSNFFIYLFAIPVLILLLLVIISVIRTINLYKICNNTQCIVKDKLIGKEIKEYYTRQGLIQRYYFYFSSYGDYWVSGEYYKWSQNFNMPYDGLYRQSDCGDEFYLVLTKRHTGKILSVYNTQMFQMEETNI